MRPDRVLLVSMPLSAPHYPSLGVSLLKPALTALGVDCEVRYFSLDYVDHLGADAHDRLTDPDYYMAHVGEWVFSGAVHDVDGVDELDYVTDVLEAGYPDRYGPDLLLALLSARSTAEDFIDECFAQAAWSDYAIVGFSSAFQQNMASLALARRIKARFPETLIIFGGTNCQGEMGIELHRRYEFVDAVCLGEGDLVFPEFARRYLSGADCADIPGIVLRKGGKTVAPLRPATAVQDMDSLPYPDFADFYSQHARSPVARTHYSTAAVFETSRGCWWGAKHHCAFCGLNGGTMAYRSKSQGRAYDELAYLAGRYGSDLANADTILDPRYFQEFIPRLAAEGPEVNIYYELKSNVKPEQMTLLARAGINKIQPGIESLHSEVLKLIDKGCTMLQNVQALKLGAENGIYVEWIALYGLPGETPAQYAQIAATIPKLHHLQPPSVMTRARADRFSPYFERPGDYGVTLAPAAAYRFIYPFEESSLRRLAYHFDMHSEALDGVDSYVGSTAEAYARWQAHKDASALYVEDRSDVVRVIDARWGWAQRKHLLEGAEAAVYRQCWKITPWHAIKATVAREFGVEAASDAVDALAEKGILLREGDGVLALALRQPGFRRAPTMEQIRRRAARRRRASTPSDVDRLTALAV